ELDQFVPVKVPGLPRLVGGAVGYLSYDVVRYFEHLPETAVDELDVPTAAFMLPDTLVIFDHAKHTLTVLANAHNADGQPEAAYQDAVNRIDQIVVALGKPLPSIPFSDVVDNQELVSNVEQSQYEASVRRAKEYIREG